MTDQAQLEAFGAGLGARLAAMDFGAAAAAGLWIGDRIEYTASQTLTVADHEALAPAGFELFGWNYVNIGGGGSSSGGGFGLGGLRETGFLPKSALAGASTLAVVVGAGGTLGGSGGESSFGGRGLALGGNRSNVGLPVGYHRSPCLLNSIGSSAGPIYAIREGCYSGANVYSGQRGGAGGASDFDYKRGGAVYPHPNVAAPPSGSFNGVAFNNTGPSNLPSVNLANFMSSLAGMNPLTDRASPGHAGV
ncbi:hypothetical protein GVN18_39290, partial [Pseudomonas sp. ODNR1LW]|nr:hypothetical protein [Pseudomonas sp. ODNR1LW]